jgi:hypothetical protein
MKKAETERYTSLSKEYQLKTERERHQQRVRQLCELRDRRTQRYRFEERKEAHLHDYVTESYKAISIVERAPGDLEGKSPHNVNKDSESVIVRREILEHLRQAQWHFDRLMAVTRAHEAWEVAPSQTLAKRSRVKGR